MRLLGIALFSAWVLAYWVSPHGEPARANSIAGAVAVAGSDRAAVAWLELTHASAEHGGVLHVDLVDEKNTVRRLFDTPAHPDVASYRLADVGEGRFVLASEFHAPVPVIDLHEPMPRHLAFERFGLDGQRRADVGLELEAGDGDWGFAAAGEQLVVAQTQFGRTRVWTFGKNDWLPSRDFEGKALLGAAGGHVLRYAIGKRGDDLVVDPGQPSSWGMQVPRPTCADDPVRAGQTPAIPPGTAEIVSVLPLRGGYARLSRLHNRGCVDGLRDGQAFAWKGLDLRAFLQARLRMEDDGTLAVYDAREGQSATRRVRRAPGSDEDIYEGLGPSGPVTNATNGPDTSIRYRLFGGDSQAGVPVLATRMTPDETTVIFERFGGRRATAAELAIADAPFALSFGARGEALHRRPICGGASANERASSSSLGPLPEDGSRFSTRLGPTRRNLPDYRPFLRELAVFPVLSLLLGVFGPLRLFRRLRGLKLASVDAGLGAGPVTVEGTLARDAEAPQGGLRVRRGPTPLRLFIDGAEVLRASDLKARGEPRGDSVDVGAGAHVVVTGTAVPGDAFRGEDTVHARKGDLVLVGCTLAEALHRLRARLVGATSLLAGATAVVVWLATRP